MYRKRRLKAVLFATIAASALYTGTRADAEQQPVHHTVVSGDTLWAIAIDHYPQSEDPRILIESIRQANGLEGYRIQPGQNLELPSIDN